MSQTYEDVSLDGLGDINLNISTPSLVFLYGDLWAGKTTLTSNIIRKYIGSEIEITSPTYVYYNRYGDIYHFDLYRVADYDKFVLLGWEEILDSNDGIILIEWPQILEPYYTPDISITLDVSPNNESLRNITIQRP